MGIGQKVVLAVGGVLLVLALFFPQKERVLGDGRVFGAGRGFLLSDGVAQPRLWQMGLEILVVLAGTAGGFVALRPGGAVERRFRTRG